MKQKIPMILMKLYLPLFIIKLVYFNTRELSAIVTSMNYPKQEGVRERLTDKGKQ